VALLIKSIFLLSVNRELFLILCYIYLVLRTKAWDFVGFATQISTTFIYSPKVKTTSYTAESANYKKPAKFNVATMYRHKSLNVFFIDDIGFLASKQKESGGSGKNKIHPDNEVIWYKTTDMIYRVKISRLMASLKSSYL